jgi:2-oxo-4-hydroxy-4-carboxy--5-ureidoimidazoline (OHCU) decarboxylase
MSADAQTKIELLKENRNYEKKFGYIFIVFATGKSAIEMLDLLRLRMENSPEMELHIAAQEQNKITNLRLKKMLSDA